MRLRHDHLIVSMTLRVWLRIVCACFANRWRRRILSTGCYRSRLPRSIGNRNQCASLVLLTPACAAESKSMPIVVSLSGSTGTRSNRNFHRPESNCGMALNCGWRVFIVLQSRLQLQIHQRQSKIATPIKGLSTANQKETFHSGFSGFEFLFMLFSQAIEERHFMKREASCARPLRAT